VSAWPPDVEAELEMLRATLADPISLHPIPLDRMPPDQAAALRSGNWAELRSLQRQERALAIFHGGPAETE
jgi:hypothetical protein